LVGIFILKCIAAFPVCSCVQEGTPRPLPQFASDPGPSIIHYGPGHQKSKTVAVTVPIPVTDNYMQPQRSESESKSWLRNWTSAHVAHFSASSSWKDSLGIAFGVGPVHLFICFIF